MNVLWITNVMFPDLAIAIKKPIPVVGGWMYSLAAKIAQNVDTFSVATISPSEEYETTIKSINYWLLKCEKSNTKYNSGLEKKWRELINVLKPDLIHIHGTEYMHGLALMKACPNQKYVISIQGLISVLSRYYLEGLQPKDIYRNITFRDIIRMDTLFHAKNRFAKRGHFEVQYLRLASNFIGRTEWDKSHIKTVNPNATYHFCNESLREAFYSSKKWDINKKNKYTIFLSQAAYPIKGLHQVIKAISLIKDNFDSIQVRIGGDNILRGNSLKDTLRLSGYAKYIKKLLKKHGLQNNFYFLGNLNEQEMIQEYLSCHIFICPSSIENSPNSLGEAQILGVPSIASYVGGVPDMIEHRIDGLLYRFKEIEMLSQNIKNIFLDDALALKLSKNGILSGTKRHDPKINLEKTIEIYNTLLS